MSADARLLDDAVADVGPPPLPRTFAAIARGIARIGWPVFLSNLVYSAMSFLTIWLLGRTGDELVLASFSMSYVLVNITGHNVLWGLGSAYDTFASQAYGARDYTRLGLDAQRVYLILTLTLCVPVTALWLWATPLLVALGQEEAVARSTSRFACIRLPGLYIQALICVLVKGLTAMGKTRAILAVNLVALVQSAALTWLLIAQLRLGLDGAAYVATGVDLLTAVLYIAVILTDDECRKCLPARRQGCGAALRGWGGYLRLALPSTLMCMAEWISWDAVTFMAGLIRPDAEGALAAQALLQNVMALAYLLSYALCRGTGTLVGNALGANQPAAAAAAARVGAVLTCGLMVAQSFGLFALRHAWGRLFRAEPDVGPIVARLMPWLALFAMLDGVQITLTGVIMGAGKQPTTSGVVVVAYWVLGLPLSAVAAFVWPANGLLGIWWGMLVAVGAHATAYCLICFAPPRCLPAAIDWHKAAGAAQARLAAERDLPRARLPSGEQAPASDLVASESSQYVPPPVTVRPSGAGAPAQAIEDDGDATPAPAAA